MVIYGFVVIGTAVVGFQVNGVVQIVQVINGVLAIGIEMDTGFEDIGNQEELVVQDKYGLPVIGMPKDIGSPVIGVRLNVVASFG